MSEVLLVTLVILAAGFGFAAIGAVLATDEEGDQ